MFVNVGSRVHCTEKNFVFYMLWGNHLSVKPSFELKTLHWMFCRDHKVESMRTQIPAKCYYPSPGRASYVEQGSHSRKIHSLELYFGDETDGIYLLTW